MRNFEKMDIRKKASAEAGTQLWHKEEAPEAAAAKQEGNRQDIQENHCIGDHQANYQIHWVADTQGLDLVKESTPSKTVKKLHRELEPVI
jgi:hypothetical protein